MQEKIPGRKNTDKKGKYMKRFRKSIPYYFIALPGIAYLFINNYMPLPGLVLAFKNYNAKKGIFGSQWVGFKNFKYLFATGDAWLITRNTLFYNFSFILLDVILAVFVAILLSELKGKIKNFYQSVILLPYMISMVIVSYLVFGFLSTDNGYLNNTILKWLGQEKISWYLKKEYWPFILIFVHCWKVVGYNSIIYLSSILGFDRSLYEAAAIDGAGKIKQITRITIPLLRPTVILMVLLSIGRIFYSDFGLFYQVPMNSGILYPVTNTIDTYVYRGLLQLGDISLSAAASFYQSVIGFVLVLCANLIVRKIDRESALF